MTAQLGDYALMVIEAALLDGPQQCRYHGTDFERLGLQFGEPRCESCRHPWRIVRALAEVRRAREATCVT